MRSELPSGTVTFLFTDVEGSTRLLHGLGAEGYAKALAEHRRVIREACARHDGVEVDTQGDAFFFAFPTAPGALAAAAAFTEALAAGPIQVRVGLHTGAPLLTEEGYVGDDVHFGARVAASSHGGQVVVSQATAQLVDGSLTDLGEHRLKDIEYAVPIFQLGDGSFPPLKTISNTNLPRPASSFVGREDELREVLARIEHGARLVSLTGPGGTGKTRLSIEAAATLVPEYKAGVFWVGLATLRDPALVTETIAQTLGAKDGLAEYIGERELLLLLDNLEQVIEAAPELSQLLQACPNLTLLVTSRELLRVQGEVEYAVPPLAESEAVSLFCERSQLEASEEISELCTRLDSLPLAVELAAARTKALSPALILERLSQRLDLLKGGRDADPRQQTLRAAIEWSYELLSPEEQQLFAGLAVFAGGCTLEAAEEVCDASLDTLQSLVEKSLLRFSDNRYWMLETIREYAGERLEVSGSTAEVRERHASHVLSFTARAGEGLQSSDSYAWLEGLEKEHDNIRAALSWMDQAGRFGDQLDLVGHVAEFWKIRGAWHEGRRWIEEALARSMGERSARRARALGWAGILAWDLGDWEAARMRGMEALAIYRELGEPGDIARSLDSLGGLAAELGDYAEAGRLQGEAVVLAREAGVQSVLARVVCNMGNLALAQGDYARATPLLEESLALYREVGRDYGVAIALLNLADCLFHTERDDEAVLAARECLMLTRSVQDVPTTIWMFLLLSAVAVRRGDLEVGARFTGIAHDVVERFDFALSGAEAELDHRTVAGLRDSLGEETYAAAVTEGRAIAVDDPIAFALSYLD